MDIHQRIADLARSLHSSPPPAVETVAPRIVEYALQAISGAQYAGVIVTTSQNQMQTAAASDRYPTLLDDIALRHREGPCFSAASRRQAVRVDDLASEGRWPRYRRDTLAETPIKSIVALPLFTASHTIGALNLYADQPYAFEESAQQIGYVLATHVALAWDTVRREDDFRDALASRDVIGQAKGILMARLGTDADAAFDLLKRLSQEHNMKLVDVAKEVSIAGNIDC